MIQPEPIAPCPQVQPTASVAVEPSVSPANLNLINLNLQSENKEQTQKRIGSRLRGMGFFITNKMLDKILPAIPDPHMAITRLRFPDVFGAGDPTDIPNQTATRATQAVLQCRNAQARYVGEPREAYPNWLNKSIGSDIVKQQAAKLTIPPTDYCPDCGETHKLKALKCPTCASWYAPDETKEKLVWHKQLLLAPGEMQSALTKYVLKQREGTNAERPV